MAVSQSADIIATVPEFADQVVFDYRFLSLSYIDLVLFYKKFTTYSFTGKDHFNV